MPKKNKPKTARKKPKKAVPEVLTPLQEAKKNRHEYLLGKVKGNKGLNVSERNELAALEREGTMAAGCVATQKELAQAIGVGLRTVAYWAANGLPKTPEGFYNIAQVIRWREEVIEPNNRKNGKSAASTEWDDKHKQAKAERAQIELRKLKGEYVSFEDVQTGRLLRIQTLKNALLLLPARISPRLEGMTRQEIRIELSESINELIRSFAGQDGEA